MSRTFRALAALSIFAVVLTGCTKKSENTPAPDPTALPAATQLMADGDKAMTDVKSAHFLIGVDGQINGLTITKAEGDLTREGSARGTATLDQSGFKVEAAFVVIGQEIWLKLATGGYQKYPLSFASSIYDPSAILDPQRGAAKLLRTAKNPKTEAKEQVDGKDTYKVSFEPDATTLKAVVPMDPTGVTGLVWLDAATKRIAKAEFKVPAAGSTTGGTVTVTFSNYDAPVTISAP